MPSPFRQKDEFRTVFAALNKNADTSETAGQTEKTIDNAAKRT